ncbi:Uncharacterized protein DBV15_03390 [Temnothorax longispinosus]|uniref:Uncharacterized protein n=1 Tax=Temnothorax longispinosus TaxID=300112 RepID=A0A4S2KMG3_9HYME|nr:Uncharacterized protein DBV15_03390 [Temnothorax longispinosus]
MDDHEIQSTVESILGPGVKVVDCEKKSCVREEEVLLINGVPIPLEGPDGVAIREAMITGQVPPCDLLNQILVKAGILRAPVRLETSLSVKSSIVTKEEVTVARGGKVVDERSRETKENNYYASSTSEIWEPVGIIHRPRNIKPFDSSDDSRPNSNASSDQGYTTSSNHVLRERGGASTAGCPICEDNDPECARRCLGGLTGLGRQKVSGVRTTTSVAHAVHDQANGIKSSVVGLTDADYRLSARRLVGGFSRCSLSVQRRQRITCNGTLVSNCRDVRKMGMRKPIDKSN